MQAEEIALIGSSRGDSTQGLSKGLLNFLSRIPSDGVDLSPRPSGKRLYQTYLSHFLLVGMDINLNSFRRWAGKEKQFYSAMYGADNTREPKNFDIKNQFDVARLAELLGFQIVIYFAKRAEDLASFFNDETEEMADEGEEVVVSRSVLKNFDIYHDYSSFSDPDSDREERSFYFVLTACGRLFYLKRRIFFSIYIGWILSRKLSNCRAGGLADAGLGKTLNKLLGSSVPDDSPLHKVRTASQLIFASDEVASSLGKLERPLVIAVYTRRGSVSGRIQSHPFSKSVLEIVYKSTSLDYAASGCSPTFCLPARKDLDILLVIGGTEVVVVPLESWAEKIVSLLTLLPAEDKLDGSYLFSGLQAGKDFEVRLRKRRADAREKKAAKRKENKRKARPKDRERNCRCELCTNSLKEYEFNMDEDGPEKLLTVDFSAAELLRLLALDSDENLQMLGRLVELSVAAFDIESKTVEVDTHKPDPSRYCQLDPHVSAEGHFSKAQKPIMVAHYDLLDGDEPPEVWTAAGDEEYHSYKMMQEYFSAVLKRQRRAEAVKEKLCARLLGLLAARKKSTREFFADYCQRHPAGEEQRRTGGSPVDHFDATYRASLAGKLEDRLRKICRTYVVFSFYGSGYDHVMLFGYLCPVWYEKGLRPKIEKRGNKVTSISLRGELTFRDITKMLAPGTNLRNFGRLFGLEQKKAHFPFSILTSVDGLERKGLPADPESWRSDLGAAGASREEIEEAQNLFREAECETVGDYLRTYLRLDVVVLFKAALLWRKSLLEMVGVDFVEARKFTISSMSNYAGTLCQAQRMRVGCFFPNNRKHYGLLKQGMRG